MTFIVLGLGSNRTFDSKTPVQILDCAVKEICSFVDHVKVSSIYRTKAMYVEDQDDFYNMVATGFYEGSAMELLDRIHQVENKYGRDRSREFRNGPRPLDVDIEIFGSETINLPELIVPHERIFERAFVLVPLREVLKLNADVLKEGAWEKFFGNVLTEQRLENSLTLVENQGIELYRAAASLEVGH